VKEQTRIRLANGKIRDVDPNKAKWAVEKGLAKIVVKRVFDLSGVTGNLDEALVEAAAA